MRDLTEEQLEEPLVCRSNERGACYCPEHGVFGICRNVVEMKGCAGCAIWPLDIENEGPLVLMKGHLTHGPQVCYSYSTQLTLKDTLWVILCN